MFFLQLPNPTTTQLNLDIALAAQASLLCNASVSSSSCTGAYTAEMGLAVIQTTVRASSDLPVDIKCKSCHDTRRNIITVMQLLLTVRTT